MIKNDQSHLIYKPNIIYFAFLGGQIGILGVTRIF